MFQNALQIARNFTLPVIVSRQGERGRPSSQIASFIILNEEGWLLTAAHVIESINELVQEKQTSDFYKQKKAELEQDPALTKGQRKKALRQLSRPPNDATTAISVWWGRDEWVVNSFRGHKEADIAVGKIESFDPDLVPMYPTFKNPSNDFLPGTSLCKLGFPFHTVTPTFNEKTKGFELPRGAVPVPLFPIEGIFSRIIQVDGARPDRSWPIKFVETSSPGLRGQSGGPTFDVQGRVWALQSRTVHHLLGFSPDAPGGRNKEHQFLNTGLGVHAETIIGFLDSLGIQHYVSKN